jgi:hypothetical protein
MTDDEAYSYNIFERVTERWPEAGDRLLWPGRDTFLAEEADERNYRLLRGYKRAGDILIQSALADRSDCRNLIFPALFNYRHYIELALKAIVNDHGEVAGVSLGQKNHKLPELWQLFRAVAAAFGRDCSTDAAIAVGACINEFSAIDASSTAFRYARDVRGNILPLPSDGLNLVQLHDVMNGIENFLECSDLDFTHKHKVANEEHDAFEP